MADEFKNSLLNVADGVMDVVEEGYVKKEAGKGLFSGKYEDLTGAPDPDELLGEGALEDYAKKQYVDDAVSGAKTEIEGKIPGNATTAKAGIVKGDGTTIQTVDGVASVVDGAFVKPAAITDMATNTGVDEKLQDYVQETEIADMATNTGVDNKLKDYSKTTDMKSYVDGAVGDVKSQLSGTVILKPGMKFASLPDPSETTYRWQLDIQDAFKTDNRFTHYNEKKDLLYPAGTNVLCVQDGDGYKWDVLGETIDTSAFLTGNDIPTVTKEEVVAHLKG